VAGAGAPVAQVLPLPAGQPCARPTMKQSGDGTVDVLMISYRRPDALRLSLPRLLETCDERTRVWLWHNGTHEETLEVARELATDGRVANFHHSRDNQGLVAPTHWLWEHSRAEFVSKVDDDCLESPGWIERLRDAHQMNPRFGVIGAWRHYPDEFLPDAAGRKIEVFEAGHQLMRNHWVQGSGYLVRREVAKVNGRLAEDGSFTTWCLRLARAGYVNGFYFPFIFEDHMDDPRSAYSLMRSDDDIVRNMPLSARRNGVTTLAEWDARNRRAARMLQEAPLSLGHYTGWRRKRTQVARRAKDVFKGRRTSW
jgi:glycosyltransferase involved in cell wall biosynthesis